MTIINIKWTDEEYIPITPKCCNVPFFFEAADLEYSQAGGKPQKYFNGIHECGEKIHITTL